MKRLSVIFCFLIFCADITLGQDDYTPLRDQSHRRMVRDWNVGIAGSGNIYFGEGDSKRRFSERLSPSFELSVSKSVSSLMSFRLLSSMGKISGWHVEDKSSTIPEYGKFSLSTVQLHALFNLSRNSTRPYELGKYELLPFIGPGVAKGWDATRNNRELIVSVGVLNKLYLSPRLILTGELRHMFVNPRMNYYVQNGKYYEGMGTLSIGLSYRFGGRGSSHSTAGTQQGASFHTASSVERHQNNSGLSLASGGNKVKDDHTGNRNGVEVIHRVDTVRIRDIDSGLPPLLVFFSKNESDLNSSQRANIEYYMNNIVSKTPNMHERVFRLIGYSDAATGSTEYNMGLSQRRVDTVGTLLSENYNIAVDQIIKNARGDLENPYQEVSANRVVVIQCF